MKKHHAKSKPAAGAARAGEGGERAERAGAGYSRPPLARMMRLHEWLMENRYPNCRKIAREFEVSAKTVQRDINFMRDQMGLPIEYDKGRFGFRYTRPVTGFPAMGEPAGKQVENPWRHSAPPAIGERPVLTAAGRGGVAVCIGFDAESARMVRSRTWHPTQAIRPIPGGGVEMTVRVRDESEIVRWVLSWGGHARLVEPARLRSRVREVAREILARH